MFVQTLWHPVIEMIFDFYMWVISISQTNKDRSISYGMSMTNVDSILLLPQIIGFDIIDNLRHFASLGRSSNANICPCPLAQSPC